MTQHEPSWLKGDLEIRKRSDGTGGNLYIDGTLSVSGGVAGFELSGELRPDQLPPATYEHRGAVQVEYGRGLTVVEGGSQTPDTPAGILSIDYPALSDILLRYLGGAAALNVSTAILPTGGGPDPTGDDGDEPRPEVPTVQAVVDYVGRATAGSGAAPSETRSIVGDGITRAYTFNDSTLRSLEVYDARERRCWCACDRDSAGRVTLIFAEPPAAGEVFTVILK